MIIFNLSMMVKQFEKNIKYKNLFLKYSSWSVTVANDIKKYMAAQFHSQLLNIDYVITHLIRIPN